VKLTEWSGVFNDMLTQKSLQKMLQPISTQILNSQLWGSFTMTKYLNKIKSAHSNSDYFLSTHLGCKHDQFHSSH